MKRFLIVGFDEALRRQLAGDLKVAFPQATIENAPAPLDSQHLAQATSFDAVLLGYEHARAEREGHTLSEALADFRGTGALVLVLAKGGNELTAIDGMRAGAADYIPVRLISPPLLAERIAAAVRARGTPPIERRRASVRRASKPGELPATVTGYRVLQTLAESDRSAVYLAHSAELDKNVALKVLRRMSETVETQSDRERFAREYQIIAQLRNPSIVEVYDFGSAEGVSYIATEYFPAGDLKTRLRNPMSPAEALDYARQIAEALRAIHVAGVLHRDLKPANVMLRADNSVVLIDFGLAKSIAGDKALTGAGEIRGSPYYMSPEQAEGRPVDERSDLYSLGVIFFELLTGDRPFQGQTVFDILAQHQQAAIPRLSGEATAFQTQVDRLLAKRPADRFQSASDLLLALKRR